MLKFRVSHSQKVQYTRRESHAIEYSEHLIILLQACLRNHREDYLRPSIADALPICSDMQTLKWAETLGVICAVLAEAGLLFRPRVPEAMPRHACHAEGIACCLSLASRLHQLLRWEGFSDGFSFTQQLGCNVPSAAMHVGLWGPTAS